jgi:2-dehydropantoate 2-reductase
MAKIAVVGCGAMGSVYAALLVDAGHEVHAVTLWPDHAEAMAARGLRCEGASGDRTVRIHASTTTAGIGPCDLVIIATKSFDVEAAAHSCLPLLGAETIVQTIQNGLGSPEIAAPILGADRLAVGVVGGFGASIRAPGHVHHNGMEMIRFGAFAGLPKQLLQASAKIWESAGFKVALFDDIKQMVWEKLIMNVAFSGTSCTTGLTVGEILGDADAWSVARGCAEGSHRGSQGRQCQAERRRSDRAHPQTRRQNSRCASLDAAGLQCRAPMRGGRHQWRDPAGGQAARRGDANQ